MSKKMKILVAVLVAVFTLITAGTITALAQTPTPTPGASPVKPPVGEQRILERVAEILGIPKEKLADAFQQARQEAREEALDQMIDNAVKRGAITEAEGKQIKDWWAKRPAVLKKVLAGGMMPVKPGGGDIDKILEKAIEKKIITADEAKQIKDWWAQRPEVINKIIASWRSFCGPRPGKHILPGMMRPGKGWGINPDDRSGKAQEKVREFQEKMWQRMNRIARPGTAA